MRPKAIVTVNGAPVAGLFFEKLVRLTVVDHDGGKADTLDMQLEDGPPHLAIPRKDDEVRVWLGYEDGPMDYMGAFKIDDVEVECLPCTMNIKGKSADLRETMKQHRTRNFDRKPFGDIFRQMAGEGGLQAQIDPEIAAYMPENGWMGQVGASNLHFIQAHVERLGGIFAIKDGKAIAAKRGAGQTAGGASLMPILIVPTMIVRGTCKVHWGQRERHKKVRAQYHNEKTGQREFVDEDTGDRGAKASYTMRHSMSGRNEAKRAARSRAKFLKGGGVRTSVSVEGNPLVKAGAPMSYAGVRPGVDGLQFVIVTATHTFSRGQAYRTAIDAKLKDGADAESDGGAGGASPATGGEGGAAPATGGEGGAGSETLLT